jgi:hypothetical protein
MSTDTTVIRGHGQGHVRGHAHDHDHAHGPEEPAHAHDHAKHAVAAPRPVRSLLALSGFQRLALAAPAIAALWLLTAWAIGWQTR